TQFHDLILMVARALARLPVIPAPAGSRFQPVDAADVAGRMAELALGEPSGLVPDLAGPKIYTVPELVNSYLRAAGKRRPLVPVHLPGQAARALRAGANLAPDRAVGTVPFERYLEGQLAAGTRPYGDAVRSYSGSRVTNRPGDDTA
ncbi:MAG TPA: NAD-dependent epimerase/dehydratase family protein, partial [Mycobacterium sp.]|nr:NAD-dependent epimerase/dehydratase family protein [Mycobacterium sp.]